MDSFHLRRELRRERIARGAKLRYLLLQQSIVRTLGNGTAGTQRGGDSTAAAAAAAGRHDGSSAARRVSECLLLHGFEGSLHARRISAPAAAASSAAQQC